MPFVNTVELVGDEALTKSIVDRSITEIADNVVTKIGKGAFYDCKALKTVNFPAVTSVEELAFQNCDLLATVNISELESFGRNSFAYCKNLTEVNFPKATSTGYSAFTECRKLVTVNLPKVTSISTSMFYYCAILETVDFPLVKSIASGAFDYCRALKTLILRSETMCTLSAASALNNTLIKSGTGYIYVPRALLSDDDATKDYRRATNWSTYASQFRALEDYTVDGTTTGELDPTKI